MRKFRRKYPLFMKVLRGIIITGVWLFLVTLLVEFVLLRGADPWGAWRYYSDLGTLQAEFKAVNDHRAYILPPGVIDLRDWSATLTHNGRSVPASGSGSCSVAFVGDSVTFGHGVADHETFSNRIAELFPGVTVYNYGVNGYNTEQVLATVRAVRADIYIYLLVSNDAEPVLDITKIGSPGGLFDAMNTYIYHWKKQAIHSRTVATTSTEDQPLTLPDWFNTAVAALAQRDDVLMVGFADEKLAEFVAGKYPNMVLIPHYVNSISAADPHPSSVGHEQIAGALKPYLEEMIKDKCPG